MRLGRVLGGVLSLLVLASCAAADPEGRPSGAGETPVAGGTLRQGLVRPSSLDPARATTISERVLADQLYDTLTVWDPVTSAALPAIAASWEASEGNRRWIFRLRPDVLAANGEPVTAADVKATLEQAVRPVTPVSDLLSSLVGQSAYVADPGVTSITGVVVVDPTTVRLELSAPVADMPLLLGNPAFGIKHLPTAGGPPVSTGPFVLSSQSDSTLLLTRAPHRQPLLDGIETTLFPDLEAAYAAFDQGNLDWVPVAPARAVEAGRKYGSHLYRPSLRTMYLAINTENPKLADRRFREAIIRAIDRPAVVRVLEGDVRPIDGISADPVPDAQRSLCGTPCAYDVEASRRLLRELFPDGKVPPVTIDVVAGAPFTENVRSRIVGDLAAVGIAADVRPLPADQFGPATVAPDREIVQTGWSGAYPSAEAFLPPLIGSASSANVAAFRSSDLDARLVVAQAETDPARRAQQFSDIERDALVQVPLIPLAQFPVASVAKPSVRGLAATATGNFDASVVWLAPAA